MNAPSCTCPSCSSATLVGSPAAGFCTSCGGLSIAGTSIPLLAVVLGVLALRAFTITRSGRRAHPTPRLARLAAA
jgi:hypothetical protein